MSDHKFLQLAKFQIALCCKVCSFATGVLKSNVADCHSLLIDCSYIVVAVICENGLLLVQSAESGEVFVNFN